MIILESKFYPSKIKFGYNWNIANDTFVPLLGCEEDANWLLAWWDYWEYYFSDTYLSHIPCSAGHC